MDILKMCAVFNKMPAGDLVIREALVSTAKIMSCGLFY